MKPRIAFRRLVESLASEVPLLVEGNRPLDRLIGFDAACIGDEDAAAGDRRSRIAGVNRRPPADGQAVGRKSVDNAGFVPDACSCSTAPFGPVLGRERDATADRRGAQHQCGPLRELHFCSFENFCTMPESCAR